MGGRRKGGGNRGYTYRGDTGYLYCATTPQWRRMLC